MKCKGFLYICITLENTKLLILISDQSKYMKQYKKIHFLHTKYEAVNVVTSLLGRVIDKCWMRREIVYKKVEYLNKYNVITFGIIINSIILLELLKGYMKLSPKDTNNN